MRLSSIRKNLNVTVENERRIQGLRSSTLALDRPVDLDYTTATNFLIELGFLFLEEIGHVKMPSPAPKVSLDRAIRVLNHYFAEAVVRGTETDEERTYWIEQYKHGGAGRMFKVLAGLSTFQPNKIETEAEEASARS
jgi:hypothetical protein